MPSDPSGHKLLVTVPIICTDDHFIVVDKPAGLLAVPGRGEAGLDSLATRVQARFPDARIVHRLDMATSGLMVFARGLEAQRQLARDFEERRVQKRYEAWVEGTIDGDAGQIDAPLAADWPNRPRQQVDDLHGKPSLTNWQVLQRRIDCTRLSLLPITGRTHQLRVHLLSVGHPIRGDALYAPLPPRSDRLLLHATVLAFPHPHTGIALRFESAAPF